MNVCCKRLRWRKDVHVCEAMRIILIMQFLVQIRNWNLHNCTHEFRGEDLIPKLKVSNVNQWKCSIYGPMLSQWCGFRNKENIFLNSTCTKWWFCLEWCKGQRHENLEVVLGQSTTVMGHHRVKIVFLTIFTDQWHTVHCMIAERVLWKCTWICPGLWSWEPVNSALEIKCHSDRPYVCMKLLIYITGFRLKERTCSPYSNVSVNDNGDK